MASSLILRPPSTSPAHQALAEAGSHVADTGRGSAPLAGKSHRQAELETEHLSTERVVQPEGIDCLLSELWKPLEEKTLYLKRLHL